MTTMISRFVADWRRRRRAAARDAEALIARFGPESLFEARGVAIANSRRSDGSDKHALKKVVRTVERRLGTDWCSDTATRYTDDRRSGLNY